MSWESCRFTWKLSNYSSGVRALCCHWISLPLFFRSATAPLWTAASSSTRVTLCVRPTTTSPVVACVRPASSQSWAAASPPWGPNSTPTTSCVTSAWSRWAKVASRSRRTSPTATPASSNSLVENTAGLCRPRPFLWVTKWGSCVTLSSQRVCIFFYCGNEGGAGLFVGI